MRKNLKLSALIFLAGGLLLSSCASVAPATKNDRATASSLNHDHLRVWYTPDFATADLPTLFSRPELWSRARSHIEGMKFYMHHLLRADQAPCELCGTNRFEALEQVDAFAKLKRWGIKVGIEADVGICNGTSYSDSLQGSDETLKQAYTNVKKAGGELEYISLDEPFFNSHHICKAKPQQILKSVLAYRDQVETFWPHPKWVEIEPYPSMSVRQIEKAFQLYLQNGFRPEFYQIDIDFAQVRDDEKVRKQTPKDLVLLRDFFTAQGVPLSIIFWSGIDPSESDAEYVAETLQNVNFVKAAIGAPDVSSFQSWIARSPTKRHDIPLNLPETSAASHTYLINAGVHELLSSSD